MTIAVSPLRLARIGCRLRTCGEFDEDPWPIVADKVAASEPGFVSDSLAWTVNRFVIVTDLEETTTIVAVAVAPLGRSPRFATKPLGESVTVPWLTVTERESSVGDVRTGRRLD